MPRNNGRSRKTRKPISHDEEILAFFNKNNLHIFLQEGLQKSFFQYVKTSKIDARLTFVETLIKEHFNGRYGSLDEFLLKQITTLERDIELKTSTHFQRYRDHKAKHPDCQCHIKDFECAENVSDEEDHFESHKIWHGGQMLVESTDDEDEQEYDKPAAFPPASCFTCNNGNDPSEKSNDILSNLVQSLGMDVDDDTNNEEVK